MEHAYEDPGTMVNSGEFNNMPSEKGIEAIAQFLDTKKKGGPTVKYRLKDWLISRQRYWGAPIPMVYCDTCGMVPVPEKDLPVLLPKDIKDFVPKGKSPLAAAESFINTTCPSCGAAAKRDADTMDTFVCSSWYFLRYLDPHNEKEFCAKKNADMWLPIDQYTGGSSEHATGHLIYFRFFTKVLYDAGYIPVDEPATNLFNLGMVLKNGQKMSKSKGNLVRIGDFIAKHSADTARLTIIFAAPPEREMEWSDDGVVGAERLINRIYRLFADNRDAVVHEKPSTIPEEDVNVYIKTNQIIAKVTSDLESFKFNTAIAALWELLNELYACSTRGPVFGHGMHALMQLLSPFAPHLADELWSLTGGTGSLVEQAWIEYDKEYLQDTVKTIVIQINGKVRSHLEITGMVTEEKTKELALQDEKIQRHLGTRQIKKFIYVPEKILNIVV
jgi:leucyl-tRNA synthetase